jgi:hypothetical protein
MLFSVGRGCDLWYHFYNEPVLKGCGLLPGVPWGPLFEILIPFNRFTIVRKGETRLISTVIARQEFLPLQTYHLVFPRVMTARNRVLAAMADAIDPRILHGVSRLPFGGNRPVKAFSGKASVHDMSYCVRPDAGIRTNIAKL